MENNPRLKVGLVFDDSLDRDDGVAQHVKLLGGWLSAQGHEVIYLVGETRLGSWQGGKIYSLAKNLPVKFNGNRLTIPLPANRKRIKDVLKHEKPDVLNVMMPHSPLMAQRVITAAAKNTAIVGTFHIFPAGKLTMIGGRFLRLCYGRTLSKFRAFISVSSAAQSYAMQAFGITSSVVANPVDVFKFTDSKMTPEANKIVFLGRLVKRKGCAELIKAFALLVKTVPTARLEIAGDGPQRTELEGLAKKLGVDNRVRFLGYINELDKPDLLATAAVACFPSLYGESFGVVLIEAMASGAQVVLGGDNPGYKTVLKDQPKMLINPKDSSAFAGRLEELLTNKALAKNLHQWQKTAVGQYDINTVGPQILAIYHKAIARQQKTMDNTSNGV